MVVLRVDEIGQDRNEDCQESETDKDNNGPLLIGECSTFKQLNGFELSSEQQTSAIQPGERGIVRMMIIRGEMSVERGWRSARRESVGQVLWSGENEMSGRAKRAIQRETFTGRTYRTDTRSIINTGFKIRGAIRGQFTVIDLRVVIFFPIDLQLKNVTNRIVAHRFMGLPIEDTRVRSDFVDIRSWIEEGEKFMKIQEQTLSNLSMHWAVLCSSWSSRHPTTGQDPYHFLHRYESYTSCSLGVYWFYASKYCPYR